MAAHHHHAVAHALARPVSIQISFAGQSAPAPVHGWLYDWQILAAGILAVLAAIVSAFLLFLQVRLASKQEERRRRRRLSAARATLPLTLATIMDYAQASGQALVSAYPSSPGLLGRTGKLPAHASIPVEAVTALERMIEATDDERVSGRLASVIAEAQVLDSRRRGRDTATRVDFDVYLLQLAKIAGAASSLFPYARRDRDTVDEAFPWEAVMTELHVFGLDPDTHPEAWGFATRARDRSTTKAARGSWGSSAGA